MIRGLFLAACIAFGSVDAHAEAPDAEEEWKPHCVDAVVIARNIEIIGIPYRLPDGEKIDLSAFRFDVDRVLHGRTTAKRITVYAQTYAPGESLARQRWLFLLSGSDATGWRQVDIAEGVVRDARGRDVYPLDWQEGSDQYADAWLPTGAHRLVEPVQIDAADDFRVCRRYRRDQCAPAPPFPGPMKNLLERRALVLDSIPAAMAARTEACVPAAKGAPAPSAEHYRIHGDLASLAWSEKRLRKGMPRREVEALLGPPDYSPTDGQFYYGAGDATTRWETPTLEVSLVLVIEYRDFKDGKDGVLTDRLQGWFLGPVGE